MVQSPHNASIGSTSTIVPRPTARGTARFISRPCRSRVRDGRPSVQKSCVSAATVQRPHSPSRHRSGALSVPEAPPASKPTISQHPDAIKRRKEAEERKIKRQQFAQATASGKGWWEVDNPSNMHLVASPDEFTQRIQLAKRSSSLVVADYFGPWCNACKALHPKLQQLARYNPEVTFLSVNAGDKALNDLCKDVGVTQLPWFHFIKGDQGLVAGFSANLTADKLQHIRAQISIHKGSVPQATAASH